MRLSDLMAGAAAKTLPPGAVAVTFDDGYADNLYEALPLLEAHGVPATMFLTTGPIESQQEFWWDALEQLLLPAGDGHERWTVEERRAPSPRHEEYREVTHRFRFLDPDRRERAIRDLASSAGAPITLRPTHRPLTTGEVSTLAASPLIDIGAHGVSHAALAPLDRAMQCGEVAGSRRALEAWLDRPVTAFAYPFGGTAEVTADAERAAREAGMTVACTTQPGRVTASTNPHRVPRVIVRDYPADVFAAQWRQWAA